MRLDDVDLPEGAEERAWHVVHTAYDERLPAPRPRHSLRLALALTAVLAAGLATISPPGRAVLDSIRESVGVEHAQPALFSLPAPGRLLVDSEVGPWTVKASGSKRLLGNWRESSWSPFGRFVVAARRNELATIEPEGGVHWTLARRGVRFPRWGGTQTDTRIAYFSGRTLRVVAGDGKNDHRVARKARLVAPAWRPGSAHVLAYAGGDGFVHVVDADRGTVLIRSRVPEEPVALDWVADRLLVLMPARLRLYGDSGQIVRRRSGTFTAAVLAPRAQAVALVRRAGGVSVVEILSRDGSVRRVFSGTGRFDSLTWSPDGRWLVVGWPTADQWVFVRVVGGRTIRAVANVTAQFESSRFPRIAGWSGGSP